MPPSNQGSRAALVTWTVITSILFVTATILAIVAYSAKTKAEEELETTRRNFGEVTRPNSPELAALREVRTASEGQIDARLPLLDVVIWQRDKLAQEITGAPSPAAAALASAATARGSIEGKPAGLIPGVTSLRTALEQTSAQLAATQSELEQARAAAAAAAQQHAAALAGAQQALAAANERAGKAEASLADVTTTKDGTYSELSDQMREQANLAAEAQAQASGQITELQTRIRLLQDEMRQLQLKLSSLRVPTQQVAQQADGRIVRTPGGDIVIIDLGAGDQISPGMTFEVYDRLAGVPAPGSDDRDDPLPAGKASIEVIRAQPGSAEARIIRRSGNATVVEGDLIANLVYDRNTRYNFVVHGSFDLDRNRIATPADAEVIRRLVTQWGGQVQQQVNVNTDFVVMGAEPQLPEYSDEDLRNDPILAARMAEAEQQLRDFEAVRDRAIELNIPILNQNRFLYLVGYYNQAGR